MTAIQKKILAAMAFEIDGLAYMQAASRTTQVEGRCGYDGKPMRLSIRTNETTRFILVRDGYIERLHDDPGPLYKLTSKSREALAQAERAAKARYL